MKQVRRNGFVMKVAYFWKDHDWQIPKQISVCTLTWRFLTNLVWIPVVVPVTVIFFTVLIIIGYIIGFPFALRPMAFKGDKSLKKFPDQSFVTYQCWPRLVGTCLRPIYFITPVFIIWSLFFTQTGHYEVLPWVIKGLGLMVAVLTIVVLVKCSYKIRHTELWQLLSSYVKAVKKKTCPLLNVVD